MSLNSLVTHRRATKNTCFRLWAGSDARVTGPTGTSTEEFRAWARTSYYFPDGPQFLGPASDDVNEPDLNWTIWLMTLSSSHLLCCTHAVCLVGVVEDSGGRKMRKIVFAALLGLSSSFAGATDRNQLALTCKEVKPAQGKNHVAKFEIFNGNNPPSVTEWAEDVTTGKILHGIKALFTSVDYKFEPIPRSKNYRTTYSWTNTGEGGSAKTEIILIANNLSVISGSLKDENTQPVEISCSPLPR